MTDLTIIAASGRLLVCTLLAVCLSAVAQERETTIERDTRPSVAPDIREDEMRLKAQRGDFVAVPIPVGGPTFGSGLIAGAAWFYPQTEAQKAAEPASLTAVAGAYTDNDSRALAIVQQNYWNRNKWRFTGAAGAADLRLSLLAPDEGGGSASVDWRIKGRFGFARLSARFREGWYGGLVARVVDADQNFELSFDLPDFLSLPRVRSAGVGLIAEFDTRDLPTNAYSGRYFKAQALFNDEELGSKRTYQNYSLTFSSYHKLNESLVMAWQLNGCHRGGRAPLWDSCTMPALGRRRLRRRRLQS